MMSPWPDSPSCLCSDCEGLPRIKRPTAKTYIVAACNKVVRRLHRAVAHSGGHDPRPRFGSIVRVRSVQSFIESSTTMLPFNGSDRHRRKELQGP